MKYGTMFDFFKGVSYARVVLLRKHNDLPAIFDSEKDQLRLAY